MSSCEPDARPDSIGTAGAAARPAINTRPWEPDQAVAAGLAVQAISKLLGKHIARNNAISPDTLFVTVGALTGFAAQYALLQDLKGRGLTPPCDDMLVVLAATARATSQATSSTRCSSRSGRRASAHSP